MVVGWERVGKRGTMRKGRMKGREKKMRNLERMRRLKEVAGKEKGVGKEKEK